MHDLVKYDIQPTNVLNSTKKRFPREMREFRGLPTQEIISQGHRHCDSFVSCVHITKREKASEVIPGELALKRY